MALRVVMAERWPRPPWLLRAKNRIIADHVGVARKVARKYRGQAELDDLVQEGTFGLYKALDKFRPEMGHKFSALAWKAVEWAMKDYLRRLRRQQRHDSSDALADAGMHRVLGMYRSESVDYRPGNIK
jgi:RNA polymerase sigma factor (sigma-70 family)